MEEGVTYKFLGGSMVNNASDISDDSFWFKILKNSLEQMKLEIDLQIFPAATDCRYIRNKGIPSFGFSPINATPILLHDHNEFLNEKIFLRGIEIFTKIIHDLADA